MRTHVRFTRVNKKEAVSEASGVNAKVERGPTLMFTRTRDLSYVACTCLYLRTYELVLKLHDSGIHPRFKQMSLCEGKL